MNGRDSTDKMRLVLASASPRRVELLEKIGLKPDALMPADLDESPLKQEKPRALAERLAYAKAATAAQRAVAVEDMRNSFFLAADTVVAVGRRILPKCEAIHEAKACLKLLSGRKHRVYTAICLISPDKTERRRIVETQVRFKRLTREEIQSYLASEEWRGKAGGYAIQGMAGVFVISLAGSYSAVVGLPVYETAALLAGKGFPVHQSWDAH